MDRGLAMTGVAMATGQSRRERRAAKAQQRRAPVDYLQRGLAAHQAGRLRAAEADYRAFLKTNPDHGDALHLLGILLHQQGESGEGIRLLERSLEAAPDNAVFQRDLAQVLFDVGKQGRDPRRLKHARHELETALGQQPKDLALLVTLGECLVLLRAWEDAERQFRAALALAGDQPRLLNNLGYVLLNLGDETAAETTLKQALAGDSNLAEAHANLGRLAERRYDIETAAGHYRRSVEIAPAYLTGRQLLAKALAALGRTDAAREALADAASQADATAETVATLGMVEYRAGRLEDAEALLARAVRLEKRDSELRNNLGIVQRAMGRVSDAASSFASALEWHYRARDSRLNHAATMLDRADPEGAVNHYRTAVALHADDPRVSSASLLAEQYLPEIAAGTQFAHHRHWQFRFAHAPVSRPAISSPDPDRPLRIGYVSPDFRRHSVPFFIEPVLAAHNRAQVHVTGYASVPASDAVTARLRGLCDGWAEVAGMDDAALAARIAQDEIDILVDLAGHTPGHRLGAFALRPAPLQMTWIGYPGTTGLDAMDYRITDALSDPDGAERFHSEALLRLDSGFLCYGPPADAPAVSDRPGGPVVFGCFSNFAKVNGPLIDLWAALLRRVPEARLLLKSRPLADAGLRGWAAQRFQARGVDPARVEMRPQAPGLTDHLAQYGDIDIALDTFPYAGTTTTCEALWMGVPVVSLVGDRHVSRVGASLLASAGLEDLAAPDGEAYIEAAAALAADAPRRAALRTELRGRMAELTDAAAFTARLEAAYRDAWRRACAGDYPNEQGDLR